MTSGVSVSWGQITVPTLMLGALMLITCSTRWPADKTNAPTKFLKESNWKPVLMVVVIIYDQPE